MKRVEKFEAVLNSLRVEGLSLGRNGNATVNKFNVQISDGSRIVNQYTVEWNKKTCEYSVL